MPDQINEANQNNVDNNSKAMNLVIQGIRSDFDRMTQVRIEIRKALCNYLEGCNTIKEVRERNSLTLCRWVWVSFLMTPVYKLTTNTGTDVRFTRDVG